MRGRIGSRRRICRAALLASVAVLAGCTARGTIGPLAACDVLDGAAPGAARKDGAPVTVELALAGGLEAMSRGVSVLVYLKAGHASHLPELRSAVDAQPGVDALWTVDEEATYADFRRLFKGQPSMLANVGPGDLPTSVHAWAASRVDADALVAWARDEPLVYDAIDARHVRDAPLLDSMVARRDRERWLEIAARLDRIEGRPAWAIEAAALVRSTLEQGRATFDRNDGDPAVRRVLTGLAGAGRACEQPT